MFATTSTTRPPARVTRASSPMQPSGSSKWSSAPLQSTASKAPSANGSASAHARVCKTRLCPSPPSLSPSFSSRYAPSCIMGRDGSAQNTRMPRAASARASWPMPAAASSTRAPGPTPSSSKATSSIRAYISAESRVCDEGNICE
jgi:hypothetical protein